MDAVLVKRMHDSEGGGYGEKHWTRNPGNLSASP